MKKLLAKLLGTTKAARPATPKARPSMEGLEHRFAPAVLSLTSATAPPPPPAPTSYALFSSLPPGTPTTTKTTTATPATGDSHTFASSTPIGTAGPMSAPATVAIPS